MHDGTRSRDQARFVNELNLIRFRKLVAEARTPVQLRIARSLLKQQEDINIELSLERRTGTASG